MPAISQRTVVALVVGLAAMLLAASANSAPPSTDPQLCLNDGWRHLQADDGQQFKSEKSCLHYVSKGGTLYRPTLTAVVFCFSNDVDLGVFASGFHPGSVVTLTLEGAVWARNHSNVLTSKTSAGENFSNPGDIIAQPQLGIPVEDGKTTGTTFITLTVRDEQGVSATTSAVVRCPFP
jgi:hypothetical protein